MTDTSAVITSLLKIAILSHQYLVWLGLQNILENSTIVPMVVLPHQKKLPDLLRAESRPDLFILDLETERNAFSAITQIRESAPTSKIVLLCEFEDKDQSREVFASGVDGIILKVQPAEVVLAVIESLYVSAKLQACVERDRADEPEPRITLQEEG